MSLYYGKFSQVISTVLFALVTNCAGEIGSCAKHGERYYKNVQTACLHVQCIHGRETFLQDHMCRDESGTCHKQGQVLTLSQCMTKTCVLKNKKLFYEFSAHACAVDGQCVDLNSTLTIGCVTYKCSQVENGHNNVILKTGVVDVACQDSNGACHPVGAKISLEQCVEHTCKLSTKGVGLELTKAECYDPDMNTCRSVGEQWTASNCQRLVCEKSMSDHGSVNLKLKTKSLGCPNEAGECFSPNDGKTFTKRINSSLLQCQCISSNDSQNRPQYKCYS